MRLLGDIHWSLFPFKMGRKLFPGVPARAVQKPGPQASRGSTACAPPVWKAGTKIGLCTVTPERSRSSVLESEPLTWPPSSRFTLKPFFWPRVPLELL